MSRIVSRSTAITVVGVALLTWAQPATAQTPPADSISRGGVVAIPTLGLSVTSGATRFYAGFEVQKPISRLLSISALADAFAVPQVCGDSGNPAPNLQQCDLSGWDIMAGATIKSGAGPSGGTLFAGAALGLTHVGSTNAIVALRVGLAIPVSSNVAPSAELRVTRVLNGLNGSTTALHVGVRIKL